LLAAACAGHNESVRALATNARHSEAKVALRWITEKFDSPRAQMPQRVADHFADDKAAEWAVGVATSLVKALRACRD